MSPTKSPEHESLLKSYSKELINLASLTPNNNKNNESSSCLFYCKKLRYGYVMIACVLFLALETAIWRKFVAPICGSYCKLNYEKETALFKLANSEQFDYSEMTNFNYPAGILYFYKGLKIVLDRIPNSEIIKESIPYGIFLYFQFLIAFLMKRCRIPAGLMIFFVLPLGLLLQGQALMFILPEMLGMTVLLQFLVSFIGGYQETSIILLAIGLSFDSRMVLPLLPVILLCLSRTMGMKRSFLWIVSSLIGFLVISYKFIMTNPSAYLSRMVFDNSQWNPIVFLIHQIEKEHGINLFSRWFHETTTILTLSHISLHLILINFRWLKADGGILGLISKFMKSNRGHGIRPNPWTPRQTLTVIFESMLISSLLRFPSLLKAEEFDVLIVMISGFFCIALADPVPLPALFGAIFGLSFPISFLYRELEAEIVEILNSSEIINFHPKLKESLHLLPMIFLPLVQLSILYLFKRSSINSSVISSPSTSPSTVPQKLSPTQTSSIYSFSGHRRSSSLSRRRS